MMGQRQGAASCPLLLACSLHSDLLFWWREVSQTPRITTHPTLVFQSQAALTPVGFGSSGAHAWLFPSPASRSASRMCCQQSGHKVKVQEFRIL